jgi:hypothetical protein
MEHGQTPISGYRPREDEQGGSTAPERRRELIGVHVDSSDGASVGVLVDRASRPRTRMRAAAAACPRACEAAALLHGKRRWGEEEEQLEVEGEAECGAHMASSGRREAAGVFWAIRKYTSL